MESNTIGRICPRGASYYTWQSGDVPINVATQNGISLPALQDANEGVDLSALTTGDVICIPSQQLGCTGGRNYAVRSGDTLTSIAVGFGVTAADVIARNPGLTANNLVVGQVLCIPNASSSGSSGNGSGNGGNSGSNNSGGSGSNGGGSNNNSNTCPPNCFTCPTGYNTATVRQGQTYSDLLIESDMAYNAMQTINPTLGLQPTLGQAYCVPPGGARGYCRTGRQAYRIDQDLSLNDLATRLNTTSARLLRLNPTLKPSDFVVGQVICVP